MSPYTRLLLICLVLLPLPLKAEYYLYFDDCYTSTTYPSHFPASSNQYRYNEDADLSTGDDRPYFYPNLNIDR